MRPYKATINPKIPTAPAKLAATAPVGLAPPAPPLLVLVAPAVALLPDVVPVFVAVLVVFPAPAAVDCALAIAVHFAPDKLVSTLGSSELCTRYQLSTADSYDVRALLTSAGSDLYQPGVEVARAQAKSVAVSWSEGMAVARTDSIDAGKVGSPARRVSRAETEAM